MHKDYSKRADQWKRVRDSIEGQDAIHKAGETYLPKTSGMVKNDTDGTQYAAYRDRGRFYDLVQNAENGILGLAFSKTPEIDIPVDEVVTIDGKTITELAKSQTRESLETGRGIMVVDAPEGGGDPYITEYQCESLTDWAVDDRDKSKLIAAKFTEQAYEADDVYKSEPKDQTREYRLIDDKPVVRVLDEHDNQIGEEISLPGDKLPIFFAGSVDTSPDIDPIPLLPIANASIAIYQLSADYRHGLFMTSQGTPWVTGIDEDQWGKILEQGMGSSALWWLGDAGSAGYLEKSGNGTEDIHTAMMDEKANAESYAVAMTEKGGIESAEALRIRAASQHATIYTVMDSVSSAIVQAVTCMAEWGGNKSGDVVFELSADFSAGAVSDAMLNSINSAINSGNLPREIAFQYARQVGYTEKTDDALLAAIMDGGTAPNFNSEN
ncbi:MAG: DUF4055 domain-containing protein [Planctomycetes bacterium]|nr:DUF4055 domain-containing protein [Planctomycetota bacterium]